MRKPDEGLSRHRLAESRMVCPEHRDESLVEKFLGMRAGELAQHRDRVDDEVEEALGKLVTRPHTHAGDANLDAGGLLPKAGKESRDQNEFDIIVGRNTEPPPGAAWVEGGR